MTPRAKRCFLSTPRTCLSLSARGLACWSVVVVCVRANGETDKRTERLVVERGQELNTERAQIFADCQAEIKKHDFQSDCDRRSFLKLSEILESQQEELHRAQAEELQRRDQQLLHAQLLQQNSELREAHHKSLNEMKELEVSELHL